MPRKNLGIMAEISSVAPLGMSYLLENEGCLELTKNGENDRMHSEKVQCHGFNQSTSALVASLASLIITVCGRYCEEI
jgi:hypothetical protein